MNVEAAVDTALFAKLVPLNSLRPDSQADLARKASLRSLAADEYLFKVGEQTRDAVYVLEGKVRLEDSNGKVLGSIAAGEPAAQHRLAHQSPRKVSARCATACRCLFVDASLLDVVLTWDQTGSFEVGELAAGESSEGDDWMAKLLQMRTFQLVPPANLQAMFMRMQEMHAEPGQEIVKQGDEGDYFYVIIEGRCFVTREQPNQKPVRLAELGSGSCFGEEALISESRRNATVTATTRTRLMRLSQVDFRKLLNEPLARRVNLPEAQKLVDAGKAVWLDVRLPSEFQNGALPGSINVPLYMLRARLGTLPQDKTYVAVCDTGRRSSVAVFVLTQRGYDAVVLDKGMPAPAT